MTQECLRYFCKRYLLFVLTYRLGVLAVVQDSWGEVLDKNRLADDPSHKELTHIISSWPNQVTTLSVAMLSRLRAQFKLTVKLHHWTLTRLVWEEAMTMWQFASTHSCGAQHAPYKPSQTLAAAILANEETVHGAWVLYDRLHLVMGEMLLGTGKKHGRKGQSHEHSKQWSQPKNSFAHRGHRKHCSQGSTRREGPEDSTEVGLQRLWLWVLAGTRGVQSTQKLEKLQFQNQARCPVPQALPTPTQLCWQLKTEGTFLDIKVSSSARLQDTKTTRSWCL